MAKFIIGVVVGIFLGASVGAYGAVVAGPEISTGWTVTNFAVFSDFSPVTSTRDAGRH